MPVYFEYALKVSIYLAIIFLFYHLLLRQITWYKWNRFFLVAFAIFSFILPLVNINQFIETRQLAFTPLVNYLPKLPDQISPDTVNNIVAFDYWAALSITYVLVVLLLFVRFALQLLSIKKIKSGAIFTRRGELEIYEVSKPVLPFSFLNGIFINKNNYTATELQKILDHEGVHVRQKHTFDVLIAEIICMINWYNPFAWLIKKAVRENLEFIADDAIIQKGSDKKSYQYLLLKVTGILPSSLANSFTIRSLKSRIRMMNKNKNSRLHLLKFALLFPLITLLLMAFRHKQDVYKNIPPSKESITKTYILSALTYAVPDKKVEAEIKNDKENCLLKTGQALDLDLIFKEKKRLVGLLGNFGHTNIDPHAIIFMIDTTLGNNSFSIQVNINLKEVLYKNGEASGNPHNSLDARRDPATDRLLSPADPVVQAPMASLQNEDK